jgi:hypothetical protein
MTKTLDIAYQQYRTDFFLRADCGLVDAELVLDYSDWITLYLEGII